MVDFNLDFIKRIIVIGVAVASCSLPIGAKAQINLEIQNQYQQDLNWAQKTLYSTNFGIQLIKNTLGCDPTEMVQHLNFTFNDAINFSSQHCQQKNKDLPKLQKAQHFRQNAKRRILIKVVDDSQALVDSWTDFRTQETHLMIQQSWTPSEVRIHLLQQLAHENAIYFDQKSNLQWEHFSPNSPFSATHLNPENFDSFLLATQNPVIHQVLASIRAFKAEFQWMHDVFKKIPEAQRVLDSSYSVRDYPFLKDSCQTFCLFKSVQNISNQWAQFALPLLGVNSYWSQKLSALGRDASSDEIQRAKNILIRNRLNYLKSAPGPFPILDLEYIQKSPLLDTIVETQNYFQSTLIPDDLARLYSQSIYLESGPTQQTGIEFLTQPSLGSFGAEQAIGPRPRIRPGSNSVDRPLFGLPPALNSTYQQPLKWNQANIFIPLNPARGANNPKPALQQATAAHVLYYYLEAPDHANPK